MAGMICVDPVGGLTNRLMAMLSVQRIARYYERPFGVVWRPSSECNARLETLISSDFRQMGEGDFQDNIDARTIGFGGQGWNVTPVIPRPSDPGRDILICTHGVLAHDAEERSLLFAPSGQLLFDLARYYRALRPAPHLLAAANAVEFERHRTISVHVRRPYSQNVSLAEGLHDAEQRQYGRLPDQFYVDLINQLGTLRPGLQFLLCTNSPTTEEYLRSHCVPKLISRAKVAPDDTSLPSSAEEALIDTLLLSRTAGVIRHHQSNFALLSSLTLLQPNLLVIPSPDGTTADLQLSEYRENGTVEQISNASILDRFVSPDHNILLA